MLKVLPEKQLLKGGEKVSKKINLIGQRFGRLTVIQESTVRKGHSVAWVCQCDCGQITKPLSSDLLRQGHIKSCGCYGKEIRSATHKTHGMSRTRLYSCYRDMLNRCFREKTSCFENYGGRGITVCDEWRNSFEAFQKWALSNGYSDELTLDRVDPDGNYCPENCRWATDEEQGNNKRNNRLLTYNGKTQSLSQWARENGIKTTTLFMRLYKYGWTVEDALTAKVKTR